MKTGFRWAQNDLLIALNLYHKLTFGQMHARQPLIIEVAEKLGRTPNSLAMKLCNLASLDPALKLRGIRGLQGASELDQEMWTRFHEQISELAPASEEAFRSLYQLPEDAEITVLPREGVITRARSAPQTTDVIASVKMRRGQEFFRESVLNNFNSKCGITTLSVRELLIASHILPWASHPSERLNIANGLCLSRVHDAAFDRGLITFSDSLKLQLSAQLKAYLGNSAADDMFGRYEGQALHLPEDAVMPGTVFLANHRTYIFKKAA